ncbi:hypothetical protein [Natrialba aegyptia]|uniref:Uncharacterized protein n=1 Tax=Natrialba aegyptia DSM 13077 TaxID=1227491 RepID=M0B239_9EURY|nr:hypothetical protein [Natrialba aegyptia]ELZ04303.1 hypothetical protein C480_12351 [Natrialba aegyptia DSM 13077]
MSKESSPNSSGDAEDHESGTQKVAAVCSECGTAYAAEKWPDGKILLIGQRTGCQCGATSFVELDDEDEEFPPQPNAE